MNKIELLQEILNEKKINHKINILKEQSLKDAMIYCKINRLISQISGPLIENYIIIKNNGIKLSSSLGSGDVKFEETNYEIKISFGINKKFNFVQIRPHHNCNYYLIAYYLSEENLQELGEVFIFKLTQIEIKTMVELYPQYAHGTKKENIQKKENIEYAFRPKYGSTKWKYLLQFRVDNFSQKN